MNQLDMGCTVVMLLLPKSKFQEDILLQIHFLDNSILLDIQGHRQLNLLLNTSLQNMTVIL